MIVQHTMNQLYSIVLCSVSVGRLLNTGCDVLAYASLWTIFLVIDSLKIDTGIFINNDCSAHHIESLEHCWMQR